MLSGTTAFDIKPQDTHEQIIEKLNDKNLNLGLISVNRGWKIFPKNHISWHDIDEKLRCPFT